MSKSGNSQSTIARRKFLTHSSAFAMMLATGSNCSGNSAEQRAAYKQPEAAAAPLTAPAKGKIPVAFLISQGVTVIDFTGPWEVFQDVYIESRGATMEDQMPFQLYTVAEKIETITASAGLKLVPDFSFETAPLPKVVVVPA